MCPDNTVALIAMIVEYNRQNDETERVGLGSNLFFFFGWIDFFSFQ